MSYFRDFSDCFQIQCFNLRKNKAAGVCAGYGVEETAAVMLWNKKADRDKNSLRIKK